VSGKTLPVVKTRTATADDLLAIMNVIDGAFLAIDASTVRARIPHSVLVAVSDDRILGALVLDDNHIDAVAVRRNRREQGIGSALVEAASERRGRLTASFRPEVSLFYASLGFEIEQTSETRCQGVRPVVKSVVQ
jgi:GNAT superfamily N-acetyltransferase